MKFKLIFFFTLLTFSGLARKADDGKQLFNSKKYSKAKIVYETLLKQRPNDPIYNYRYAYCCYELKEFESAIPHFEMAGTKFPDRDFLLAESYFNTYRFEQSVAAYQNYIATLKPDDKKQHEYDHKIKKAELAARLLTKIDDIAIVDSVIVNKNDFLKFYKFSSELGKLKQELLKIAGKKSMDKITFTTQREDRICFSDTVHGQMNILNSYKLLDTWSNPTSISSVINSSANENYPFILLDGITMYFASDGSNSIGGYDIFVTRFTPATNSYLAPENVGFPFNSTANDYMMVIDEQHNLGWFSTDRNQPSGKVAIFTFVPNPIKSIVRSEDEEYVRQVAQLKIYRKAHININDSIVASEKTTPKLEKQIEFVINDSVVYTHLNQFKFPEATTLWRDLNGAKDTLLQNFKKLEEFRTQYANQEMDAMRLSLSNSILKLEKETIEIEKKIELIKLELRNKENSYLSALKSKSEL